MERSSMTPRVDGKCVSMSISLGMGLDWKLVSIRKKENLKGGECCVLNISVCVWVEHACMHSFMPGLPENVCLFAGLCVCSFVVYCFRLVS